EEAAGAGQGAGGERGEAGAGRNQPRQVEQPAGPRGGGARGGQQGQEAEPRLVDADGPVEVVEQEAALEDGVELGEGLLDLGANDGRVVGEDADAVGGGPGR